MEEESEGNFSFDSEEDDRQDVAYHNLFARYQKCFTDFEPHFENPKNTFPTEQVYNYWILLMELINTGAYTYLTQDSIKLIHDSILCLIYLATPETETESCEMSSSITFPHVETQNLPNVEPIQNELNNLKSENADLKAKLASIQEDVLLEKNNVSSKQEEYDKLATEKKIIEKSLKDQKQELSNEISQLKQKLNVLSERHEDAITKMKLMTGVEDSLRNQLNLAHAEADGYAQQCEKLSNSLSEKKEKIYQLKFDLKKAEIKISDLKTRTDLNSSFNKSQQQYQLSSVSSPSSNHPSEAPNQDSHPNSMKEQKLLNAKYEAQNKEMELLKKSLKEKSSQIESQNLQLSQQDEKLRQSNSKTAELQNTINGFDEKIKALNDIIHSGEENNRNLMQELHHSRFILARVSEQLSTSYKIERLNDIPDIIDDLLLLQTANNVQPKTLSIIDGLTRFINQFLLIDKPDPRLLTEPCPSLVNDRKLLNQITQNINDIKEMMNEEFGSKFEQYKMFDALLSAKEHFTEDSDNCEFAALLVLCSANEKLRRICTAQKKQIEQFNKVFPVEKIPETRRLFNQLARFSNHHYKQSFEDNLQLLNGFFDNTSDYFERLRKEILPFIHQNCEILELPDQIVNTITEIRESNAREATNASQSFVQAQHELQDTLTKTEARLERTMEENDRNEALNKKLSLRVKELEKANQKLKDSLDKTKKLNSEVESSFSFADEKRQEYENKITTIQNERDHLQGLLNQRQENSQARTEALIASEREYRAKEIERLQAMHNDEKAQLMEELNKRTARLKAQKQKDKELIEYMEKKMKEMQNSFRDGSFSQEKVTIVTTDEFTNAIIKELNRCVQVSNDWSQQKILSAIHKVVTRVLESHTEEQWRKWGIELINADKSTKSSAVRKQVEQLVSRQNSTEKRIETLRFEKQVLVKFEQVEMDRQESDLSACGLIRAMLFCAIAKRIMRANLKPRKNYI
ncbi:hypothetical protein TRFO_24736 [Tritrichomonas foetus]|uniref:Uncharacterized protein n=1 Tax=Tritrichomonas foetus TaxID=1144522 RepID=A0A1J4KBF8_9EUKA|nr:hypothetical protein TRFO_24736 [Tritrichomonas foetus]|eukprot:OHT07020.1 hypothetical protein TRFO_24736 [Tritrichomonas foetus]